MSLKIYNTYTNKIEEFKENEQGKIGLYTCGPTVYDYAHIGNYRSYMFEDLFKRYLIYLGYKVNHIMNITDIEDKIIKKSNELNITLGEVTQKYIDIFYEDNTTLNIIPADIYPRATEHIEEMILLIKTLLDKGYAYKKGNSVYFSIEKFKGYGKLANIKTENLKIGASVDLDEYDKDNVQDFVLWKGGKKGEPSWEADFGNGRPGWHIECSAMSMKYLGENFDIHMGGVDNIFPHHENEIAQSECATGKKFVNFWIHCQHLIVDNQKMSKSLGNSYTLRQLIDQGYDAFAIRYLLLSAHYRKLLNFTLDAVKSAEQSLKRINNFIFTLSSLKVGKGETEEITDIIKTSENKFRENMNNDLNISGALGVFYDFIHDINLKLDILKEKDVLEIQDYLNRINSVLGIIKEKTEDSLDREVEEKIKLREKARKERNFNAADQIRNELESRGIILIDTAQGTRWKFKKE